MTQAPGAAENRGSACAPVAPAVPAAPAAPAASRFGAARFLRHHVLPGVGPHGQEALRQAGVLVVGAGGLGCAAATYLATMGIGRIGIMDHDHVEASNLHRQFLYRPCDVGRLKAQVAVERLSALSPDCRLAAFCAPVEGAGAARAIASYDLVIDGTDNHAAHAAVSDACRAAGKAVVAGAVHRFEGRVTLLAPDGPCYRCLAGPSAASGDSCGEAGVLGSVPGIVGTLQATQAVRHLLGIGKPLQGRILVVDAWDMQATEFSLAGLPRCDACRAEGGLGPARARAGCGDGVEGLDLTVDEFDAMRRADPGLAVLDVRTRAETAGGTIPGSRPAPLDELAQAAASISAGARIVAYCETGVRSREAAARLQAAGRWCRSLAGGWRAWSRAHPEAAAAAREMGGAAAAGGR